MEIKPFKALRFDSSVVGNVGNGYGKLKEQTFHIAHMGDIAVEDLKELLAWIDEEIK